MTRTENIPGELCLLSQWVCVSAESKVPLKAWEKTAASTTNPETWASYYAARETMNSKNNDWCDYLGFVFAGNGIVGIDIDCGVDAEGFITPLAADIIGRCRSYTERSKSGRGFHILLKGVLPFKGKNNLAGVEIYQSARYFILTGDVLLYRTLEENQAAIDYVLATYFPDAPRESGGPVGERIYTPVWAPPAGGRVPLRPSYPRITPGSRNLSLTSLAGALHGQGWPKAELYAELLRANAAACDPPLDRREIQSIVNSVTRYKR